MASGWWSLLYRNRGWFGSGPDYCLYLFFGLIFFAIIPIWWHGKFFQAYFSKWHTDCTIFGMSSYFYRDYRWSGWGYGWCVYQLTSFYGSRLVDMPTTSLAFPRVNAQFHWVVPGSGPAFALLGWESLALLGLVGGTRLHFLLLL